MNDIQGVLKEMRWVQQWPSVQAWANKIEAAMRDKDEELDFLRSVKESRGRELVAKDAEIERLTARVMSSADGLLQRDDEIKRMQATYGLDPFNISDPYLVDAIIKKDIEIVRLKEERDAQYDLNVSMTAKHASMTAKHADEIERLHEQVADMIDASGQQCGCGYDGPNDVCLGHWPAYKKQVDEINNLRAALLELFEEGEFQHCTSSRECFTVGRVGRGAYETPLDNAAGGRWFAECSCMTDAQRKAADLLNKKA